MSHNKFDFCNKYWNEFVKSEVVLTISELNRINKEILAKSCGRGYLRKTSLMSDVQIKKIAQSCEENGVQLDFTQILKLFRYYQLSCEWGQKMNLTTNLGFDDYLCENILDPLLGLATHAQKHEIRGEIIDLGAGAGYVGLTAKIAFPGLKRVSLVEGVRKKVSFMQYAIRELGLEGVEAVHARAEEFSPAPIEVGLVVSRATWSWADFKGVTKPYFAVGYGLLSFEGPKAHEKQTDLPSQVMSYTIKPHNKTRYLYFVNHSSDLQS